MDNHSNLTQARRVIIFSPHQDDAELGCGGLIAKRLTGVGETHIVYLTDGRNSHIFSFGIKKEPTPLELIELRKQEVTEAQKIPGNGPEALHFFNFEDVMLFFKRKSALNKTIDFLTTFRPTLVLVPYRYEKHPDHRVAYDVVTTAIRMVKLDIPVYQYFVWGLSDILVKPNPKLAVLDIRNELETKKAAILRFKTQITCFSKQQTKPLLDNDFLQNFYSGKEFFLADTKDRESCFSIMIRKAESTLLSYEFLFNLAWKVVKL